MTDRSVGQNEARPRIDPQWPNPKSPWELLVARLRNKKKYATNEPLAPEIAMVRSAEDVMNFGIPDEFMKSRLSVLNEDGSGHELSTEEIARIDAQLQPPEVVSRLSEQSLFSRLMDQKEAKSRPAYLVIEDQTEGNIGEIHKAFNLRTRQTVLIKFVREQTDPADTTLFRTHLAKEATVAAKAAAVSSRVVSVLDYLPKTERGPALVMKYMKDEKDLQKIVETSGALGYERVQHITTQLCEEFDRLWKLLRLLHFDIKPRNILLQTGENGEPDVPFLVDFGLSGVVPTQEQLDELIKTGNTAEMKTLLAPQEVFGAPPYLSPERVFNRSDAGTPQSEIFSLALTIYFLLTGKELFFKEGWDLQQIVDRIAYADTTGEVKMEITRALHRQGLSVQVAENVAWVLNKALKKDPGERFGSFVEFGEEFVSAFTKEPIGKMREDMLRSLRLALEGKY